MYLKEGRSLVLKLRKSPMAEPFFLLNTTKPIPNPNDSEPVFKESDVLKRLNQEPDLALAMDFFKSISNSGAFSHTPLTYHAMIDKLSRHGQIDRIQYLLHQMKLQGISCSEDLFVTVINSTGYADLAAKTQVHPLHDL